MTTSYLGQFYIIVNPRIQNNSGGFTNILNLQEFILQNVNNPNQTTIIVDKGSKHLRGVSQPDINPLSITIGKEKIIIDTITYKSYILLFVDGDNEKKYVFPTVTNKSGKVVELNAEQFERFASCNIKAKYVGDIDPLFEYVSGVKMAFYPENLVKDKQETIIHPGGNEECNVDYEYEYDYEDEDDDQPQQPQHRAQSPARSALRRSQSPPRSQSPIISQRRRLIIGDDEDDGVIENIREPVPLKFDARGLPEREKGVMTKGIEWYIRDKVENDLEGQSRDQIIEEIKTSASLDFIKAAVQQNGHALKYFEPFVRFTSEEQNDIRDRAVNQFGSSIKYIYQPTLRQQKLAVQKSGFAIKYIYKSIYYDKQVPPIALDEEVKMLAVYKDPGAIEFIYKNEGVGGVSDTVKNIALRRDASVAAKFINKFEKARVPKGSGCKNQLLGVMSNPNSFKKIKKTQVCQDSIQFINQYKSFVREFKPRGSSSSPPPPRVNEKRKKAVVFADVPLRDDNEEEEHEIASGSGRKRRGSSEAPSEAQSEASTVFQTPHNRRIVDDDEEGDENFFSAQSRQASYYDEVDKYINGVFLNAFSPSQRREE